MSALTMIKLKKVKIEEIACFIETCLSLNGISDKKSQHLNDLFNQLIYESHLYNQWFVSAHVKYALELLVDELRFCEKKMSGKLDFLGPGNSNPEDESVYCIYKPDAPLEGIIELLILAFNYKSCFVKIDESQKFIATTFIKLIETLPELKNRITIAENLFINPDKVFVLGKVNQTVKEYMSKYNLKQNYTEGTAVVINKVDDLNSLSALADQICMFFGRNRNSCKVLFVPEGFDLVNLESYLNVFQGQLFNNKYFNNYEYRKSVMIINHISFIEMGPLLVTESMNQAGYISVLCIQRYTNEEEIKHNPMAKRYKLLSLTETLKDSQYSKLGLSFIYNNPEHFPEA